MTCVDNSCSVDAACPGNAIVDFAIRRERHARPEQSKLHVNIARIFAKHFPGLIIIYDRPAFQITP